MVDLAADEATLWSDLRAKWRQYVNRARSGGVTVVERGGADLPAFHAIMAETSARTGTPIRTEGSYRAIWDAFGPAGRARLLFALGPDGAPQAVLFLLRAGSRIVEPYGGMTTAGATSRANYLLKWEAIRSSRAAGGSVYDMWGLVHPGIRQFKEGFGGREVRLIGGFDLDLRPLGAGLYRLAERQRGPRRASGRPGPGGRPERARMTIAERLARVDAARRPRPLAALVERLARAGRLRAPAPPTAGRSTRPPSARSSSAGLTADSRTVVPGALFVAVPGDHVDGHEFAVRAAAAGAVAAIVEHPLGGLPIIQLVVDRSRAALAEAAGWWYGDPSRELGIVGITGTDGKTTTSFLAAAALAAAGPRAGLVGTVELRIGGQAEPTPEHQTTPEAPELQRLLRAMAEGGDAAAIVETTSHGLALERVAGVAYDAAILTNLTHEHLELHGTFEAYRAAKLSLFERLAARGPAKTGAGGRRWPGRDWPWSTGTTRRPTCSSPSPAKPEPRS